MSDALDQIVSLQQNLGLLDYYELLGIEPTCDYVQVREAYHARAQIYHPDRFMASEDSRSQRAAYDVFKRMTEAFGVLSDPTLRQSYDRARASGDNRLPVEARSRRLDQDERLLANASARAYFHSARCKLDRGDPRSALVDVELGLSLERAEPLLRLRQRVKALLAEEILGDSL